MGELNAYVKQLECVSGYKIIALHEIDSLFKMDEKNFEHIEEEQQRKQIVEDIYGMWPWLRKQHVGQPFVWVGEQTVTFGGVRANESLIYLVQYEEEKDAASFYSMLCLLAGNIVLGEVRENDIICLNEEGRHEFLSEQKVEFQELIWQKEEHHSYAEEERLLGAVKNGDSEELQSIIDGGFFLHVGITSKCALTHQRNICISVIALAARAAIRGDVPSELAYQYSDEFLLKLDTIYQKEQVYLFMIQALHSFTVLVQEEKSKRTKNSYVEQCKLYVAKYHRQKILVSDIASYLGLNSSYLSHLFHKETGMTINEYIQREKVRVAKNYLRNSDIDILAIAHSLSFSSQSYFGRVFRSVTGTTPQKYRDMYKLRELSSERIIL